MKRILYSFVAFMALASAPASAGDDMVVVELFTSQGCMACPPADKIMAKIAREEGIIALSWPVDYWDYLGWKDTFASAANTKRQAAYNQAVGRNGIYTPQVFVNGQQQVVGSREGEIRALIQTLKAKGGFEIDVKLDGDRENLMIDISAGKSGEMLADGSVSVWLIMYDAEQIVDIQYGDNRGRSLSYANIVRGSQSLGSWSGGQMRVAIDMDRVAEVGADCIAVLVQQGEAGPILGATKLILSDLD